jgi:molecular chaperone Hsp33
MKEDFLITTISKNNNVHGYYVNIKNSLIDAQKRHDMNIISTSIFSRAMIGTTLLSGNLKNKMDYLSVVWNCTGPIKKIFCEANYEGNIRGYIGDTNLQFIEDSFYDNNIKAEPYIGFGEIIVSRNSFDDRPPYNSVVVIETGEIAQDISSYLDQGLQIQSALKIGISVNENNKIEVAGGILFMAMPGASKTELLDVYHTFESIGSLTEVLKTNVSNINVQFKKLGLDVINVKNIRYKCTCNKFIIKGILKGLNKKDLKKYIIEKDKIEVACQYCGKMYNFNINEL